MNVADGTPMPDVVTPIRAYRAWMTKWITNTHRLRATGKYMFWSREMEARCLKRKPCRGGLVPETACQCGLYGTKEPSSIPHILRTAIALEGTARFVFGAVDFWGKVIEHDWGYRAQYARIATLYDDVGNSILAAQQATQWNIPLEPPPDDFTIPCQCDDCRKWAKKDLTPPKNWVVRSRAGKEVSP